MWQFNTFRRAVLPKVAVCSPRRQQGTIPALLPKVIGISGVVEELLKRSFATKTSGCRVLMVHGHH